MSLPEGGWIMSNTGDIDDMYFYPTVEVQLPSVSDNEERERIWVEARDSVSGRIVHYCENEEDYWILKSMPGWAKGAVE